MRTKTIKEVLNKKMMDWTKSIKDKDLKVEIHKNAIVTGGCIASMLLQEDINDFDIYFKTKETTLKVAKYYVDQWNKSHGAVKNKLGSNEYVYVLDGKDVQRWKKGKVKIHEIAPNYSENHGDRVVSHMITGCQPDQIKIIYPSDGVISDEQMMQTVEHADDMDAEDLLLPPEGKETKSKPEKDSSKYHPIYMSSNAITLSDDIQITIRFYGTSAKIHNNYDFEHCKCYYDVWSEKLVTPESALLAILAKELVYTGSKYPICSIIRTRKFLKRGWRINAGQYLKICFQISDLDLYNLDVLEDQLVGVDTVYFMNLINQLRLNPNVDLTQDYVASVIDKVFG